jgi:hypothetical protein
LEGREGPRFSFRGFGPPLVTEVWFPRGSVRGGSFGRKLFWIMLTPLLVLTLVLSRLFAHVLVF